MSGRLHVIPVDGGQPAGIGVMGEAALDVENVSALAPGAQIDVYEAPNTTAGSLDEFSRIIADDSASVITTSAGLCEAAMQSDEPGVQAIENILFEQAAAQGQTVVAAAGDDGSSDCGTEGNGAVPPSLSVDDPASQPFVLGVGGTSVSSGSTPVESVWNDGPRGGGGRWRHLPDLGGTPLAGRQRRARIRQPDGGRRCPGSPRWAVLRRASRHLSGGARRERGRRSGSRRHHRVLQRAVDARWRDLVGGAVVGRHVDRHRVDHGLSGWATDRQPARFRPPSALRGGRQPRHLCRLVQRHHRRQQRHRQRNDRHLPGHGGLRHGQWAGDAPLDRSGRNARVGCGTLLSGGGTRSLPRSAPSTRAPFLSSVAKGDPLRW